MAKHRDSFLSYCMSYNLILLCIVTFWLLDPLLSLCSPASFISFVLIILMQLRLHYYASQYLAMIELHTHLRDCHSLYNSEVCFHPQCTTPILTNPVDMINYRWIYYRDCHLPYNSEMWSITLISVTSCMGFVTQLDTKASLLPSG